MSTTGVEFAGLDDPYEGMMRVWFSPSLESSNAPFFVEVEDEVEGNKFLDLIASFDTYLTKRGLKPDHANVCGIEVFEEGEWIEVDPDA